MISCLQLLCSQIFVEVFLESCVVFNVALALYLNLSALQGMLKHLKILRQSVIEPDVFS